MVCGISVRWFTHFWAYISFSLNVFSSYIRHLHNSIENFSTCFYGFWLSIEWLDSSLVFSHSFVPFPHWMMVSSSSNPWRRKHLGKKYNKGAGISPSNSEPVLVKKKVGDHMILCREHGWQKTIPKEGKYIIEFTVKLPELSFEPVTQK